MDVRRCAMGKNLLFCRRCSDERHFFIKKKAHIEHVHDGFLPSRYDNSLEKEMSDAWNTMGKEGPKRKTPKATRPPRATWHKVPLVDRWSHRLLSDRDERNDIVGAARDAFSCLLFVSGFLLVAKTWNTPNHRTAVETIPKADLPQTSRMKWVPTSWM